VDQKCFALTQWITALWRYFCVTLELGLLVFDAMAVKTIASDEMNWTIDVIPMELRHVF